MSPHGRYICLSGGEGTGKTTVINRLKVEFPDFVYVREPGGTPFSQTIRQLILDRQYAPSPWAELFLLMTARIELFERIVHPALEHGQTVVSDRCWIETLVYQVLSKIGDQAVPMFLDLVRQSGCPMPDLWLWFDLDPREGLRRRTSSGDVNSFDTDALEMHERYRQEFGRVQTFLPTLRLVKIDAAQAPDDVYSAVKHGILPLTNLA